MIHLITEISRYLLPLLFLIYTFQCFYVFRYDGKVKKQKSIYKNQTFLIFLIHFIAYMVLYLNTKNKQIIEIYLIQIALFIGILLVYYFFYKKASELLLNNMLMLLSISFVILTRISFDKALKQLLILIASSVISLIIPILIQRMAFFRKLTWVYAILGIGALSIVMVIGATSYGAKLSISIMGISIQPSEFVKILYIFFIASMLSQSTEFKQLAITSFFAALHVLILVGSRDLGGALLYFITYLVMVYVATKKFYYFAGGILGFSAAAVFCYKLFNHVRVRVLAWKDPISVIDKEGYQISQSLFAIGTGSWFGLGLCQGIPTKIPVVEQDFIFSAIAEELGIIFSLCLIMVCVSCFFMFLNIALQMKDAFYRLVALGLGVLYAFQVFLTIGGVTKFIPSTGVTLPLVSYGGSSLLSTMILFGIIQGLYIMKSQQEINFKDSPQKIKKGNSQKNGTKKQPVKRKKQNTKTKKKES